MKITLLPPNEISSNNTKGSVYYYKVRKGDT